MRLKESFNLGNVRLGDKVESLAKPIAKAIDSMAGTKIAECGGCKKRKEWLNNLGHGKDS